MTSDYCFELEDQDLHYNVYEKRDGLSTVEHEQNGDGNMFATAYTRTCKHTGVERTVTLKQILAQKKKKRKKINSWRKLFAKRWPREDYGFFEIAGLSTW